MGTKFSAEGKKARKSEGEVIILEMERETALLRVNECFAID
jgi:hypothetical protein